MIPCSVVIEGDDVPARVSVGTRYNLDQRYVLFAYVPCDPANPNDAAHAEDSAAPGEVRLFTTGDLDRWRVLVPKLCPELRDASLAHLDIA